MTQLNPYTGKNHFIGIGGIGTSGLAKLLMRQGAIVSGSDMCQSPVIDQLQRLGATVRVGHTAENLPEDVDAVVISAAVTAGNPELARASELGCPIHKYAQMLGQLFDACCGIAVSGTHGKSTTGAWISYLLSECRLKPNFIIGAEVPQLGGSSGVGNGRYFVAEACEYDRSFLNLHPHIAIILNIEQEKMDYYRNKDEKTKRLMNFSRHQAEAFDCKRRAIKRRSVVRKAQRQPGVTVGLEPGSDYTAQNAAIEKGLYTFDVLRNGRRLGRAKSGLPGPHNVYNAVVAAAACIEAGVPETEVLDRLGYFGGIDRRLMLKAQLEGVTILDDYAHHPTEIRASLAAIRQRYEPRRLWCVFQPHQYSRTRFLLDDFAESFKLADITIVPEIYFVRDTAESKSTVNAEILVDRIRQQQCQALFINEFAGIVNHLKQHVREGDVVVTMGAGTIWKVADEYIQWLREHR